jgi:hypothetical protein
VKWWYSIVLVGILAAGLLYIWLHRVELGLASPPVNDSESIYSSSSGAISGASSGAKSGTLASDNRPARIFWQNVDRSRDGFKVEMPADIKEMRVPAYNSLGSSEQVNMIYAYPDAQTSFSVAWADNPPVERASFMAVDKTLDTAVKDALVRTQTMMVRETKANRRGFPARDFLARNTNGGIFNARLILVGQRLYMLVAAFPSDAARQPQDVARFFDSFAPMSGGR